MQIRINKKQKFQILLFCTLFFSSTYYIHVVVYDNARSRLMLTSAIVDYHTFSIDNLQKKTHLYTVDVSIYGGKNYSNKAPGVSLLAVPVYWLIQKIDPVGEADILNLRHRYFINFFTNSIVFALLGIMLFRFGLILTGDPQNSLMMVISFAFGSIAWSHSQYMSGHLMTGAFCFFGFMMLVRLRFQLLDINNAVSIKKSVIAGSAGLLIGIGAICDFTAMYLALIITIYVLWIRLPKPLIIAYVFGGCLTIGIIALYNWQCFGSPWSTPYHNLSLAKFVKGTANGVMGIGLLKPRVLHMLLFSPSRGLFFMMPVFLFSLFGLLRMFSIKILRPEMTLIIAAFVGYLCIYGGYFGWHGGWTYGPRYLVPILPFLAIAMVFSRLRGCEFVLLITLSILLILPGILVMPYTPHEFKNPVIEAILPLAEAGYYPNTWLSLLGVNKPLASILGIVPIILLIALLVDWSKKLDEEKKMPQISSFQPKTSFTEKSIAIFLSIFIVICFLFIRSPIQDRSYLQYLLSIAYQHYIGGIK